MLTTIQKKGRGLHQLVMCHLGNLTQFAISSKITPITVHMLARHKHNDQINANFCV